MGSTRRWGQRGDATEHNNAKKEGNAKGDNLHPKQSESDCLGLVVVAFVLVGAVAGGDAEIVSVGQKSRGFMSFRPSRWRVQAPNCVSDKRTASVEFCGEHQEMGGTRRRR